MSYLEKELNKSRSLRKRVQTETAKLDISEMIHEVMQNQGVTREILSHRTKIKRKKINEMLDGKRNISIRSDAHADLHPVEAFIGPKLREAILDCYAECG